MYNMVAAMCAQTVQTWYHVLHGWPKASSDSSSRVRTLLYTGRWNGYYIHVT